MIPPNVLFGSAAIFAAVIYFYLWIDSALKIDNKETKHRALMMVLWFIAAAICFKG